jgi:hypothetical protein
VKLTHHVPSTARRSATVSAEYQAEVDRSTAKTEAAYARAQQRLAAAERRKQRAEQRLTSSRLGWRADRARELRIATELVEIRREELLKLQDLMRATPASVEHRGRGGYRPVPQPGSPL